MDKEGVVAKSAMSRLDCGSISNCPGKQASDLVASVSGRGGLVSRLCMFCQPKRSVLRGLCALV